MQQPIVRPKTGVRKPPALEDSSSEEENDRDPAELRDYVERFTAGNILS